MRTRGVSSLAELRQASVHCHQWFWDEALRDLGLEWTHRYTQLRDMSRGFPWTRWFAGGEINVTHQCVDRHVRDGHGAEVALIAVPDAGRPDEVRRVTFAELAELVDRCALALRAAGVQRGDCVALAAPPQVAAAVVLFATMKLGARFVPVTDHASVGRVREQLTQSGVKLVFVTDSRSTEEGSSDSGALVRQAAAEVAGGVRVVGVGASEWEEFLASGGCMVPQGERVTARWKPALPCEVTHAEEPCLVLFTVDGAGRLHGAVHTHAGCLAQMGRDLWYAFDVKPGEPFLWRSDAGAMTGVWKLIGCLLYRTPVVLVGAAGEGATGDRWWALVEKLGVVTLGCSPAAIRSLMKATNGRGPRGYDLSRLRVLGSTGGAWDEAGYRWYFEQVGGGRCPIVNFAGGAEIAGGLVQPYPLEPLKACSLGGPALGMDVDVYSPEGKSAPRGAPGQLVCKQPAPSMTKSFLHDDAGYVETFFQRFPGVWHDGGRMTVDADGQWFFAEREGACSF